MQHKKHIQRLRRRIEGGKEQHRDWVTNRGARGTIVAIINRGHSELSLTTLEGGKVKLEVIREGDRFAHVFVGPRVRLEPIYKELTKNRDEQLVSV